MNQVDVDQRWSEGGYTTQCIGGNLNSSWFKGIPTTQPCFLVHLPVLNQLSVPISSGSISNFASFWGFSTCVGVDGQIFYYISLYPHSNWGFPNMYIPWYPPMALPISSPSPPMSRRLKAGAYTHHARARTAWAKPAAGLNPHAARGAGGRFNW